MRIIFLGTGDIGLPTLDSLIRSDNDRLVGVITQPDKPVGRRQEMTPSPVKIMAHRHLLPVFQPDKIRNVSAMEQIRYLNPDLLVVMAYGQILPREILDLPRVACLNLHASILPRHRGAAPVQAAIHSGDATSGVTVMHMAEGLDTGDILHVESFPIRRRETGGSLHERLALAAPRALSKAIEMLRDGTAPRTPQDNSQATYAPKLNRDSGRIDWRLSACVIERGIRAFNPWPSAWCEFPSEPPRKMKIFTAIVHRKNQGPPGEIIRADDRGLLVGTGEGALLIRDLQIEGRKRLPASEFLRGNPVPPGWTLR